MSLGAPRGGTVTSSFAANWEHINLRGQQLASCAFPKSVGSRPQGGHILFPGKSLTLRSLRKQDPQDGEAQTYQRSSTYALIDHIHIEKTPVAVLYMYNNDSPFTDIMNRYMTTGKPVIPLQFSSVPELGVSSNGSLVQQSSNISLAATAQE